MKSMKVLVLALALAACGGEEEVAPIVPGTGTATPETAAATPETPTPTVPPMPTVTLSPEETARAEEIAGQVTEHGRLPREITSDKTLARIFLYLVATSDDVNVIKATTNSLSTMWSVDPGYVERGATLVDDTYVGVFTHLIHDERPEVQEAALVGGAVCFRRGNTNMTMLDAYIGLASAPGSTPALRYAVLDKIWQSSPIWNTMNLSFPEDTSGTQGKQQPHLFSLENSEHQTKTTAAS